MFLSKMHRSAVAFLLCCSLRASTGLATPATLWVSKTCPYAARAWIACIEKDIEAEVKIVDLQNKPVDFVNKYQSIAPDETVSAKVPIFENKEVKLIESAIISEYMCDAYDSQGAPLRPQNAAEGARVRLFCDTYDKNLGGLSMKILRASDEDLKGGRLAEDIEKAIKVLNNFFEKYQEPAASATGSPFLLGRFSLAEVITAPFIVRLVPCMKEFCDMSLLEECKKLGCHRLHDWIEAVNGRPSVTSITPPEEDMVSGYKTLRTRILSM
jgi:glutathione S-transferase